MASFIYPKCYGSTPGSNPGSVGSTPTGYANYGVGSSVVERRFVVPHVGSSILLLHPILYFSILLISTILNNVMNVYLFQPGHNQHDNKYNLPYSVGCLWAYAVQFQEIVENYTLKRIIFDKEDIDQLIDSGLEDPAVCVFSCYIWNDKYCRAVASRVKERWPNCVVMFGGPDAEENFTEFPYVDLVVVGEGEIIFKELLDKHARGEDISGVHRSARINDLESLPSPYLTGVFDQIMNENPEYEWFMTYETNRGCPYACTFCNWGGLINSKVRKFSDERVFGEIDWTVGKNIVYIFVADANFGILVKRDMEIAYKFRSVVEHPDSKIRWTYFNWAKNSNDTVFEIARVLGNRAGMLTLSRQSMNDSTLNAIKRKNMQVNDTSSILLKALAAEIAVTTEMILGLPLETVETFKDGLSELLSAGQHNYIPVYFAIVLPHTELAEPRYREEYGIKTVEFKLSVNRSGRVHIPESIEIITETNTMSKNEMDEMFRYSSLITGSHSSSITSMQARYCHDIHGISYRKFYDTLEKIIINSNSPVGYTYEKTLEKFRHRSSTGESGSYSIELDLALYLIQHHHILTELSYQVLDELGIEVSDDLRLLFDNVLYKRGVSYPMQVYLDFDPNAVEFKHAPGAYLITGDPEYNIDVTKDNKPHYLSRTALMEERIRCLTKFVSVSNTEY